MNRKLIYVCIAFGFTIVLGRIFVWIPAEDGSRIDIIDNGADQEISVLTGQTSHQLLNKLGLAFNEQRENSGKPKVRFVGTGTGDDAIIVKGLGIEGALAEWDILFFWEDEISTRPGIESGEVQKDN